MSSLHKSHLLADHFANTRQTKSYCFLRVECFSSSVKEAKLGIFSSSDVKTKTEQSFYFFEQKMVHLLTREQLQDWKQAHDEAFQKELYKISGQQF